MAAVKMCLSDLLLWEASGLGGPSCCALKPSGPSRRALVPHRPLPASDRVAGTLRLPHSWEARGPSDKWLGGFPDGLADLSQQSTSGWDAASCPPAFSLLFSAGQACLFLPHFPLRACPRINLSSRRIPSPDLRLRWPRLTQVASTLVSLFVFSLMLLWTHQCVYPVPVTIISLGNSVSREYPGRVPQWGIASFYKTGTCFQKWVSRPFTASSSSPSSCKTSADWMGGKESLLFICLSRLLSEVQPSFTFTGCLISCFHIEAFLSPLPSPRPLFCLSLSVALSISFWFFLSCFKSPE